MGKEQSVNVDVLETAKQEDLPQEVKERIKERRVLIIIHSSRVGVTNLDTVKTVQLNDRFIEAHYLDGTKKIIGMYDNDERAAEVFEELLYEMFPQNIEVENGLVYYSHVRNRDVYYLPEE